MKKSGFLCIFALLMVFSLVSCGGDDDGPTEPDPDPDPVNIESASMVSFRTQTPTETIYYMNVFGEVPAELSTSNAIELGANQRIFSFGESPYTWNGNASTLTKWNVSRTDLSIEPDAIMSVAGIGISGDLGEPSFVSETEAYFFALDVGKVIEFNPTEMTITETHDVPSIEFPGTGSAGWYNVWIKYEKGDRVIMPIGYYSAGTWDIPTNSQVAVFDTTTKTITYEDDDRLLAAAEVGVVSNNGDIYLQPAYGIDFAVHYGAHTGKPSTTTTLRMNEDGTFDDSFSYDFSNVIDSKFLREIPIIADNKAVVTVAVSEWDFPADPEARWGSLTYDNFLVDMETDEVSEFTALNNYDVWFYSTTTDNTNYFVGQNESGETLTTFLLRQNAIDDYTEVTKFEGGVIQGIAELW